MTRVRDQPQGSDECANENDGEMQIDSLKEVVIVFEKEVITSEGDEKGEKSVAKEREARRLHSPSGNGFVRVLQFARHVRTGHDA